MFHDVLYATYDARGNGDGKTVSTLTGDHENRITDYTSVVCEQMVFRKGTRPHSVEEAQKWEVSEVANTLNTFDQGEARANELVVERCPVFCIGNGQLHQMDLGDKAGALNCMHDQQAVVHSAKPPRRYIVRRLTPTECARLQVFPDWWGHPDCKDSFTEEELAFWQGVRDVYAEINGKQVKAYTAQQMLKWYNGLHTDSAEYKMWCNGIALPPALYVMQGIVDALDRED